MIETVHQAPGRFDLDLDRPPEEIRALTARAYAALIVTPAPLAHPEQIDHTTLLGLASYVGILRGRSEDRTSISGYGPAILLTLAKRATTGSVTTRPLYNGAGVASWIYTYVLRLGASENNGITVGTIASAASPSKTGKVRAGQTPLEILNDVCRRFSREWRVNPNGTLDVAAQATLWPSTTTPTVVATPVGGGRDLNITGLPAVDFDETDDWDDYTTTVTVNDSDETHTGTDTLGSVPYVNPYDATALVARRVVTSSTADTNADCATIATQQLGRFDQPQREITLTTDAYNISDSVEAGDTIYVFDVDNDLYNLSNPVQYQGRTIYPATVRVTAVRDACSSEKGYLLYSWNGSAMELHDLTPYVAFEPSKVTLECGEPRRRRPPTPTSI